MYWEELDDVKNVLISNSMRRNRFETIMPYLHFNDNLRINTNDKTFKISPCLQMLRKSFFEYIVLEIESSIDGAITPYYLLSIKSGYLIYQEATVNKISIKRNLVLAAELFCSLLNDYQKQTM